MGLYSLIARTSSGKVRCVNNVIHVIVIKKNLLQSSHSTVKQGFSCFSLSDLLTNEPEIVMRDNWKHFSN